MRNRRLQPIGPAPGGGGAAMPAMPAAMAWRYRVRRLGAFRLLLLLASFLLSWHLFHLGGVNVTLADCALFLCLALLVTNRRLNFRPFGSLSPVLLVGLFLLLGGMLAGSAANGDPLRWMVIAGQYAFAYMFVPMILFSAERPWLRKCVLFFALGVAAAQAFAIAASFVLSYEQSVNLFGYGFITGRGRIGAFASDANWNAAMIAFALPMLLNSVLHREISVPRSIPVFLALVWGLLASASFTGFSAGAIALAIFFLIANPRNALKFGLPLVLLAGGYFASGLPLPAAFEQRVAGAFESGDMAQAGTYVGRKALAGEAWRMAGDTLLLGVGADEFREVSVYNMPVHVFPLLILVEGGVISFLGLMMIALALGLACFRATQLHRDDGAMAWAIYAVFLIFTFSMPHMYARLWIAPLFLALGVSFARMPWSGAGAQWTGPQAVRAQRRPAQRQARMQE